MLMKKIRFLEKIDPLLSYQGSFTDGFRCFCDVPMASSTGDP